ncbi:Uncharacterised protein [Klebsiella pneumoniae]|nr:Uncharacterised protein [Klebsiella pneumoniae]
MAAIHNFRIRQHFLMWVFLFNGFNRIHAFPNKKRCTHFNNINVINHLINKYQRFRQG